MKSTMEKLTSNKVRIDFVVDAARFEKAMNAAYRKNVGKINVQGFRKGKAPRKVIEMIYGESIFYEDAIDELFPEVYSAAIAEHGITPVDRPDFELKEIGTGKDLVFTVEVFVKPDVELGQYKGVEVTKHTTEVTEDDVNAEIERARERVSRYVDVEDRAVMMDDQVTLNYAGFCDGEQFEGGTAEGHKLVIGSGSFIPGFEEQLVGAEIGKEVEVNVTFPEQYHAENLKGKAATFKCTVTAIQEKDVPELDDEFAKDVSECETLEEYRAQVRSELVAKAAERDDVEFENAVIEAVVATAKVDIPEAMIEDRIDERMNEFSMQMSRQGINMETYYQITGQNEEALRGQMKEMAENDVRVRLVLEAIRDAENVEVSAEEIDAEIAKYAERNGGDAAKFAERLTAEDRAYFESMVKMQKTVKILKDAAVIA